jgi:hypothetical protein
MSKNMENKENDKKLDLKAVSFATTDNPYFTIEGRSVSSNFATGENELLNDTTRNQEDNHPGDDYAFPYWEEYTDDET